tara:strand:+ start:6564 stop:6668 length:105 start_codon:yes stop_codon:yes gene_type:complete
MTLDFNVTNGVPDAKQALYWVFYVDVSMSAKNAG